MRIQEAGNKLQYLASSDAIQKVEPRKLRSATIKSADEKNTYEVTGFRDRNVERRALFIPKKELNARGIDGREISKSSANVVEVKLRNLSRPKESLDTYYGRVTPSNCLLYTSPSPRDLSTSRMPSSA